MSARIFIAIPVHNRLPIAERCIPTVRAGMGPEDVLVIYDDHSTPPFTKPMEWLKDDARVRAHWGCEARGIERQRRQHFMDFWRAIHTGYSVPTPFGPRAIVQDDYTHLYLTDSDALHASNWRTELLRLQGEYGLPICGYNTPAHERMDGNTISDEPDREVIIRRVAPGISYLLTCEHVEKVTEWLVANPEQDHWQWDWTVPGILGGRFAVTRTSVVDHIGFGGYHHPPEEGYDGGDRALNPTQDLVAKRAQVVAELKALI